MNQRSGLKATMSTDSTDDRLEQDNMDGGIHTLMSYFIRQWFNEIFHC